MPLYIYYTFYIGYGLLFPCSHYRPVVLSIQIPYSEISRVHVFCSGDKVPWLYPDRSHHCSQCHLGRINNIHLAFPLSPIGVKSDSSEVNCLSYYAKQKN